MKVLLVNGSPHKNGTTKRALMEIQKTLTEEGIASEIFEIEPDVTPCRACNACEKLGKCVLNDCVNDFILRAKSADGFIFASPVHYAAPSALLTTFMGRCFYAAFRSGNGNCFTLKPASAVVCARRAGTTAALEQINKYFTISQMPVISGRYWNMVFGANAADAQKDIEGLQNMRFLAKNMAYYLKNIKIGKTHEIMPPHHEQTVFTNFVRE